jgi:hypothetical protein
MPAYSGRKRLSKMSKDKKLLTTTKPQEPVKLTPGFTVIGILE